MPLLVCEGDSAMLLPVSFGKALLMARRQIVDVVPNTSEWYEWRASVRTASQAPVIMGAAPSYWEVRTWDQLRNLPVGERPAPVRVCASLYDRGHRMEQEWMAAHVLRPHPVCLQRDNYSASLDGHIEDPLGFQWWEIKTVRNRRSQMWAQKPSDASEVRERFPHVWWQLVHQAHVVGDLSAICLLVVVLDETVWHQVRVPVDKLLADWPALEEQWDVFAAGGQPGLQDEAWLDAALSYLEADKSLKAADLRKKLARKQLLIPWRLRNPTGYGVGV